MPDLKKRRVYVMGCGHVVKIGVSGNVEHRKEQLPFNVRQYYSTEPIDNAFEIEKQMHRLLANNRLNNIREREYFEIGFEDAKHLLKSVLSAETSKVSSVIDGIGNKTIDGSCIDFICSLFEIPEEDLIVLSYVANGLMARQVFLQANWH